MTCQKKFNKRGKTKKAENVPRNMMSEKVPYLTLKLNDQEIIFRMLKTIV